MFTKNQLRTNFHLVIRLFDRTAYASKYNIFQGLLEIASHVVVSTENINKTTHQAVDETFVVYCKIPGARGKKDIQEGVHESEVESRILKVLDTIGQRLNPDIGDKEVRFVKVKNVSDTIKTVTIADKLPMFTSSVNAEFFHNK